MDCQSVYKQKLYWLESSAEFFSFKLMIMVNSAKRNTRNG